MIEDKAYLPNADAHLQDKKQVTRKQIYPQCSSGATTKPTRTMSSLTRSDDMNHQEKFIPDITPTCGYPDEGVSNPPTVPIAPLAVGSDTISNLALLVEAILNNPST